MKEENKKDTSTHKYKRMMNMINMSCFLLL